MNFQFPGTWVETREVPKMGGSKKGSFRDASETGKHVWLFWEVFKTNKQSNKQFGMLNFADGLSKHIMLTPLFS